MRRVLISLALPVVVLVGTVAAHATSYSLESVYGGVFAITDTFYPSDDTENHTQDWTDPVSLNETRFADSFLLDGWSTAESNLSYSTTSTTITASGSVINGAWLGSIDGAATYTESFLDILFSVPVLTLYQLDATVSQALSGPPSTLVTHVVAYDWGPGASGFATSATNNQTISQTGTLTPAEYRLTSQVKILDTVALPDLSIDSTATFEYVLTLTPVPEPATLSLLALGGLAMLRRKR